MHLAQPLIQFLLLCFKIENLLSELIPKNSSSISGFEEFCGRIEVAILLSEYFVGSFSLHRIVFFASFLHGLMRGLFGRIFIFLGLLRMSPKDDSIRRKANRSLSRLLLNLVFAKEDKFSAPKVDLHRYSENKYNFLSKEIIVVAETFPAHMEIYPEDILGRYNSICGRSLSKYS